MAREYSTPTVNSSESLMENEVWLAKPSAAQDPRPAGNVHAEASSWLPEKPVKVNSAELPAVTKVCVTPPLAAMFTFKLVADPVTATTSKKYWRSTFALLM